MHPLLNILIRATLALLASALILFAIFVTYMEANGPEDAGQVESIHVPVSDMRAVLGSAEPRGDQLAITRYDTRKGGDHAIVVWRGDIKSGNYPLMRYQLDAPQAPLRVQLIWQVKNKPGEMFFADLDNTVGDRQWLDLTQVPNWQGTIVDVGFFVLVASPEQALSVSHLTFAARDWRAVIASQWFYWTSFRGWVGSSINYLPGTTESNGISPLPVAAAWSALAAVLLLIAGLLGRKMVAGALAAVLLIPWVSLDLLWQRELSTQLEMTRDQFAGKSVHEKHLADYDSDIYQYIMRLKDAVLPEEPSRVLLLHDSEGHNYQRLKAQYYLLPHNVYNLGRLPPNDGFSDIDHILVLGDVVGLEFHSDTNTLVWNGGTMVLPAELLDSDSLGRVYRLLKKHSSAEA